MPPSRHQAAETGRQHLETAQPQGQQKSRGRHGDRAGTVGRCAGASSPVQSLSRVRPATPLIAARQASLSTTNSRSLPKPMSIESVMPSSRLILCCPLLLLPPILPSIRVFSNESTLCMRWPKYWSLSFSISPSNEHPGLISSGMDWLDLLAVQGTLKSLLQHHSSKKTLILQLGPQEPETQSTAQGNRTSK